MCIALFGLSLAHGAGDTPGGSVSSYVNLGGLLLFLGAYQVSFGPISWLIVGEIFPAAVRSEAIALATLVNFGSNFVVSLALPPVQDAIGAAATYAMFGVVGLCAVASIYFTVPETKGKALEEIEAMWFQRNIDG